MHKVPLVHYVNGERIEIGEAVVDIGDDYIDVSATVKHPDYIPHFVPEVKFLSLGMEARGGEYLPFETNTPALRSTDPVHIRARGEGRQFDGHQEAEESASTRKERRVSRRRAQGRAGGSGKGSRPQGA